jgi:hypothetical protein
MSFSRCYILSVYFSTRHSVGRVVHAHSTYRVKQFYSSLLLLISTTILVSSFYCTLYISSRYVISCLCCPCFQLFRMRSAKKREKKNSFDLVSLLTLLSSGECFLKGSSLNFVLKLLISLMKPLVSSFLKNT